MPKYTCEITVKPKGGKSLESGPLDIKLEVDAELTGSDKAIEAKVASLFDSKAKKRVASQLGHLETWIKEKNDLLDGLQADAAKARGFALPLTSADASFVKGLEAKFAKLGTVDALKKDYQTIITNWAAGMEQQGLIAWSEAVKEARADALFNKKARVRLAAAVKGTLILIGTAAAITAAILTAPITIPAVIAIGAIGIGVSGLSGGYRIAKSIKDVFDIERRILSKTQDDLKAMQSALGKINEFAGTVPKHATELQNLLKTREGRITELKHSMMKVNGKIGGYKREIQALKKDVVLVNQSEVSALEKKIDELGNRINKAQGKIDALETSNKEAAKVLADLEALGADLKKVAACEPNSILGGLKKMVTTADGWASIGDAVGGVTSAAASVAGAKT